MKFEINGNADDIEKYLPKFIEDVEREYEPTIEEVKKKISALKILPIKPNIDMPPISMTFWKENEKKVIFANNLPSNPLGKIGKPIQWAIKRKMKKSCKKLEAYFKENGVKVKVKFIGD